MLIPLPIGLWVFSFICDIAFKAGWGGPLWEDVAFFTMVGGTLGALLAALPGFVDLLSLDNPRTKKVALWHMLLNLAAVVVFAINIWLRTRPGGGNSNLPFGLSILGILLICVSGWLGGELVYVHQVAVNKPSGQSR